MWLYDFYINKAVLSLPQFVAIFIQLWHHYCPTFTEQEKLEKIPGKTHWSISVLTIFFPFQAYWIYPQPHPPTPLQKTQLCIHLIYTWEEGQCPTWIFTLLNICLSILQLVTDSSDVWSKSNLNPKPLHCHTGFWRTKGTCVFTLYFWVPRVRLGHSFKHILFYYEVFLTAHCTPKTELFWHNYKRWSDCKSRLLKCVLPPWQMLHRLRVALT